MTKLPSFSEIGRLTCFLWTTRTIDISARTKLLLKRLELRVAALFIGQTAWWFSLLGVFWMMMCSLWTLIFMPYSSLNCVLKWLLAHCISTITTTWLWWILTLCLRLWNQQTPLHLSLISESSLLTWLFDNADLRRDLTLGGCVIHLQCLEPFIVSI